MICSKCQALNDESSEVCYNCGTTLEKKVAKKSINPFKKVDVNLPKKTLLILIGIALVVIIVVVTVVSVLNNIEENRGFNLAKDLSQSVGETDIFAVAEKNDIYFETKSVSSEINTMADAKYLYESDRVITVDGVKVPTWIIKVDLLDEKIAYVYYRDYTVQDANYKGVKVNEPISTLKVEIGQKLSEVNDIFGIKPISVKYFETYTEYLFNYYYINEAGDEQEHSFKVTFDEEMLVSDYYEYDLTVNDNIK